MKALWIDANFLFRFLTGTAPECTARAPRLLQKAEGGKVVRHVSPVVAALVWVLCGVYTLFRAEHEERLRTGII